MCGIFGIIDVHQSEEKLTKVLNIALKSIYHRGPDGKGLWTAPSMAFGMRRLAILDIDGGTQPLYSKNGTVLAFLNGEIYNFKKLKQELLDAGYSFISNCDTEVLAHGFVHWGMRRLLERLDGMFAIAIYDQNENKLFLARDRYGEKPLFIASGGGRFAYSSSLVPLAALPWVDDRFEPTALHRYLCLGFAGGAQSLCAGVQRVLPGCWAEITYPDIQIAFHRYYSFPVEAESRSLYDIDELDHDLSNAVTSRLISDVPIGVFLSGGIDSSLVAHYAALAQPGIQTFSMGFNDVAYDESRFAKAVAEHIGSTHHHFSFDEREFMQMLPIISDELDEPVGDQACLPLYILSRQARKHVTVVLSGEGADEIFGGYSYYSQRLINREFKIYPLVTSQAEATSSGFPYMMSSEQARSWVLGKLKDETFYEKEIRQQLNACPDIHRVSKVCDILTWLPDDLLVKLDRMTMAASIEGRVPYLAPDLFRWACLTSSLYIKDSKQKLPLMKLAERYLPRQIWDRPKQGFILPMRDWLSQWFLQMGGGKYCLENAVQGLNNKAISVWVDAVTNDAMSIGWERSLFSLLLLFEWATKFSIKLTSLTQSYRRAGL